MEHIGSNKRAYQFASHGRFVWLWDQPNVYEKDYYPLVTVYPRVKAYGLNTGLNKSWHCICFRLQQKRGTCFSAISLSVCGLAPPRPETGRSSVVSYRS